MATWTAATAINSGGLITSAWMNNIVGAANFLGAASATAGKDLFFARQTVAQTIPNATVTALTFSTEDIDVAGGHSIVSNTSRYTAQASGKYRLTGSIACPAFALADVSFYGAFYKNGSLLASGAKAMFVTHSTTNQVTYTMPAYYTTLTASTDYVELVVFKAVGFNTEISASQSTFGVEWVGAS